MVLAADLQISVICSTQNVWSSTLESNKNPISKQFMQYLSPKNTLMKPQQTAVLQGGFLNNCGIQ